MQQASFLYDVCMRIAHSCQKCCLRCLLPFVSIDDVSTFDKYSLFCDCERMYVC